MSMSKPTRSQIQTPSTHYGNAKASTRHFITQRVTGAFNIAFLGLLLFVVVRLAGQDRADVVALLGNWYVGVPFAALIAVAAIHMRNGMRDTLEDYTHGAMYRLLMLLNTLFCLAVALIGAGSVLKIVFWG